MPALTADELTELQELVADTYVSPDVVNYIVSLIAATRKHSLILRGASPRATLAVTAMAKACARLRGRDFVTPEDVQGVFVNTIAHRLLLSAAAETKNISAQQILAGILSSVKAPQLS